MPVKRSKAEETAQRVIDGLSDVSNMIVMAGSVRRGNSFVKDVEVVAMPKDVNTFLGRIDGFVARDEAKQAIYPDGKKRWGEHYRGLLINGIKVEIFLADADNWGFQLWLRTGPWDSNKEVMGMMLGRRWPVRFDKGYAWEVKYNEEGDFKHLGKLRVASEHACYSLIGIDYMPASERELYRYRRPLHSAKAPERQLLARLRVDAPKPPKQAVMF